MAVFARDRGARDIGLYLTQATSSGIERVTSTHPIQSHELQEWSSEAIARVFRICLEPIHACGRIMFLRVDVS